MLKSMNLMIYYSSGNSTHKKKGGIEMSTVFNVLAVAALSAATAAIALNVYHDIQSNGFRASLMGRHGK